MPPKLPFQSGSQVEHAKFGLGSVVDINESRITIKYDDHGEKTFVTSIALPQLKKSDREPPQDKSGSRKRKAAGTTTRKSSRKKAEAAAQSQKEE